jgi:D-amino-acid dehydrogenase
MSDVLVVGGGIVGASAAYHLTRRGATVTLVDRADDGQATAAGAGILSPGTSYKPPTAYFPLAFRAVAYYDELLTALAEDGERETGYEVVGLLHVAIDDDEAARLPELFQLIAERAAAGAPQLGTVERITGDEARRLFPVLSPDVLGAIATSGAARVDGRRVRQALLRAAERHGATLVQGSATLVYTGQDDARRAVGVSVALADSAHEERMLADAVIVAGGAWSAGLLAGHAALPVYPQRGQILHLNLPHTETARWPVIVGFHSHYLLTFPERHVVAGATREHAAGFDVRMTAAGVHEALGEALRVAPGLQDATVREVRIGLRPASPDGLPMLGRMPRVENLYVATGMGASGLQLGPYCGALAADLALSTPPPADLDLTPYLPDRF